MMKQSIPISTPPLTLDRLQALKDLVPEAFTEGQIDFDKPNTGM